MWRRIALTSCVLGLAGAAQAGGAHAAPAGVTQAPTVAGYCAKTAVRPGWIRLSTDGSGFLAGYRAPGHMPYSSTESVPGMQWSEWTNRQARASAWEWVDSGGTAIGNGTFHAHRATVHLYRPVNGVFTRMTIIAPHVRQTRAGSDRLTLHAVSCSGGRNFSWN